MKKIRICILISVFAIAACRKEKGASVYFLSPEEGTNIAIGKPLNIKLDLAPGSFDSVKYLVDTTEIASKTDTSSVNFPTDKMDLGITIVTAKIYKDGTSKEITTNLVLLPATAPREYTYSLINTFPHDTSSYTQGLEYHDGIFYESDGGREELGGSSIRKVEVGGKVLKQVNISTDIFAEGLTVIDDKVIQLTWQNGYGIVYDKATFNKIKEFPYQESREGWGLCFDGKSIIKSDGTNRLYFLNKDSYIEQGYIEVYDSKGAIDNLNELEYINGKIYANVYQTNNIVIIDPATGAVEAKLDLSSIYPETNRNENADVLNGIAWDPAGKRLFVTGKKWDKLFEIKIKE